MVTDVLRYMTNMPNRKSGMRKGGPLRQKTQRKQQGMTRRSAAMIPHPPQLDRYEIRHSQVLRFVTNTAVASNITFQNLLDSILLATSATAVYDLFDLVKINFVKVWSIGAVGAVTTCQVAFEGQTIGQTGDNDIHTDTSIGVEPAFVNAIPAKKSLAAIFQPSTAGLAFVLLAPSSSVVDVSLSLRSLPGIATLAQHVAVGATVGSYNYRGLDGLGTSTTNYVPVVGSI